MSKIEREQRKVSAIKKTSSAASSANPLLDPTQAKASEQQQPSSSVIGSGATAGVGLTFIPAAQAFDSVNFVDCFLSSDVLKEGTDK